MSRIPDGIRGALAAARLKVTNAKGATVRGHTKPKPERPYEGHTDDSLTHEELYEDRDT